ncbi:zinc-dependent peptidase [Flavivirga amylovorans]|uniref:Zinc-dependent peptidase n=1 Tax=Flavivirga amylovorans TaxID=870486 RepID=A0ABT8X6H3_9FLAO|nr:zinc-dependent peptidase [Flavivirga amylovorans]MDO5989139.1 zinc-dependent peptidase [Flavivirga amylovorans]
MFQILVIQQYSLGSQIILGIFFVAMGYIFINYGMKMIEMGYVLKYKRPLYNHFYLRLRRLNKNQKAVLRNQFSFYKKLTTQEKKYFEHRVASFIKDKDFIGRDGIVINDEIKVLIASTAVMLTFGFRDFYIGIISKIVIYPGNYYSNINKAYHKGEFNPRFKTLVLSWEDFVKGFDNESDNLNLGIHEITHAIHINSMKERDVSSIIFSDSFKELSALFSKNELLRDELQASDYFRKYAYTNQFEFLAVTIENFIETPQEFRSQFPEIYSKIKQMLNFKVKGY